MNRVYAQLLFWLALPMVLQAQPLQGQARLDSLLAKAQHMGEDSNAIKLMNLISFTYTSINPDEGLRWAARELALAQKIGWRKGEGIAYNDFGNNYKNKSAHPDALEAFFKALRIVEELGDKGKQSAALSNIGLVYYQQKKYAKAQEYHLQALKVAEEQGDTQRMRDAISSLGIISHAQGRYEEALAYMKQGLHFAEEAQDAKEIVIQTGNIGALYGTLRRHPTALAYGFKALRIANEIGDGQNAAVNLGNIGEAYYNIAADSTLPDPDSLVPAGRAANLAKAVAYLSRGIAACREAQLPEAIPEFSDYLSRALALQGDYKGALEAYKLSKEVDDSLYNLANNEKIAGLETQRALALKDKDLQIARLKKRNERVLFAGGFAGLLLFTGVLFRNFRKQQHSNALLSKEKRRSDDLLLNILPAEVAEELKTNGGAQAKQFDAVSVLFTDFVNFTGRAENLSPQMLVRELHECFSAFDAIMERYGLEKIKTIGDAYMAVSGLPNADPQHAQKAVRAAQDILLFMQERGSRERTFGIRIGIHSGPVVAGIVGVKKFAYDIWGDTVNTAARMESSGEPGKINISATTYELIKDDFPTQTRGAVEAKGKGKIEMYFVGANPSTTVSV